VTVLFDAVDRVASEFAVFQPPETSITSLPVHGDHLLFCSKPYSKTGSIKSRQVAAGNHYISPTLHVFKKVQSLYIVVSNYKRYRTDEFSAGV